LLDKPDRRLVPITVDYVGFEIPTSSWSAMVSISPKATATCRLSEFSRSIFTKRCLPGVRSCAVSMPTWLTNFLSPARALGDRCACQRRPCPRDEALLRDLVARAAEPSRAHGLTLEDCSDFLGRLGQELRVSSAPLPKNGARP